MQEHRHLTRHSPSTGPTSPDVWGVYEADTGSIQYVAACPRTKAAVVIDAVLNFDPAAARTATTSAETLLTLIEANGLTLTRILDTHPHADHLMAAAWLKARTGVPNAIGARVREIAALWGDLYNAPGTPRPEAHFDTLLEDGARFAVGDLAFRVLLSPGHTLGSISYLAGDAAFAHDTLMMPDMGSSRADFPGGSASDLWASIQTILALPERTRVFVGHDYGTKDRDVPAWEATVGRHLAQNRHVKAGTKRADFIALRQARDATLKLPARMLHALQINLRGGALPEPEADGHRYLKIPMNRFR